ncbi:MAG: triose-phosphate isomerase [Polyangiaceae bacterium]
MKRRPLIAGNWKMYKGGAQGVALARDVVNACGDLAATDVVIAPPFTALAAVAHELSGSRVGLAAQNLHPKPEGAFTGEVSAPMLKEAGCGWVIIGHSERRQYFGETDDSVREKVAAALEAGLHPIVCVGETLQEREGGKTMEVVFRQLDAFAKLLAARPAFGVIAYEPVWAIGTGKVAGPEQAEEVHAALRGRLGEISNDFADQVRILYGGSVKPDNALGLFGCANVDGALVGGASLSADGFVKIVQAAPTPV